MILVRHLVLTETVTREIQGVTTLPTGVRVAAEVGQGRGEWAAVGEIGIGMRGMLGERKGTGREIGKGREGLKEQEIEMLEGGGSWSLRLKKVSVMNRELTNELILELNIMSKYELLVF